ncbi:head maturation protease, ClpP-related [uncultured Roseibium sp.]|uniref:head maturation protease, ClpP-related n=1 Tax=uncultured Roseibium sp. TaxID=1936171 RepID=UPI00262C39DD|nr:head maturation protease, ClpP-related [uncultured Roseibium sp.]
MAVYVNGELVLYGFVGDNYWDEGFTDREVLAALAEHGSGNDLPVRLNSGGGYVDAGRAIFNALKLHEGTVTIYVDGIAASSASLIAMAGDKIVMRSGSIMMIHDPATITFGTADDHEVSKQALERMGQSFAETYAARSGQNVDDVRTAMKATTWMTAEEAVEAGYADEADESAAKMVAAFDFRAYANAPSDLTDLSKKRGWTFEASRHAASAAPTSQKETEMADKPKADGTSVDVAQVTAEATAAANERVQAILGSDEAKGREAQAQHLAFKTQMTAEDAIAVLASAPVVEADAGPTDGNPDLAAYEAQRMAAAGQAQPTGQAEGEKPNWTAAIERAGKQRRKGA